MPKDPTYYETWLHNAPLAHTKEGKGTGVLLNLRLRVYHDGHGNLIFIKADGHDGKNEPVATTQQAIDAFAALWEKARQMAGEGHQ